MDQKDDFDLREFLPYLLNQAAEESSLAFQQVYKGRYGMLRTEWRVLFHLGIFGSMTAKEIGRRAKIHKTKVSRAVQKLEDRRFLERTRDLSDRRVEHLKITQSGLAAYRDLRNVARDYDSELVKSFTDDEAKTLKRLLAALAR